MQKKEDSEVTWKSGSHAGERRNVSYSLESTDQTNCIHGQENSTLLRYSFSLYLSIDSVQFSLVVQSCPTLCDRMNRSTPGLPVHHQHPEFTQIHVHWVREAIQPSHPLSSPSPPAPNPSQHQSLFQWVNSSMRWPKYWSFSFSIIPSKEIQDWSPSEWTGWISLQSKGLARVFSNTTVQKHQFFGALPCSQSNSHIHTWPQEKP